MANPFSYEGKRIVLTGAYSGVGAALLELLDELGAEHITVIDLKAEKVVGSVDTLKNDGYNPNSIVLLPDWNDLAGH